MTENNSLEHYLCIHFLTCSRPRSVTVHSATGGRRERAFAMKTCTQGVVGPHEGPGDAFITYHEGRLIFSKTITDTAVPRVPSDFSCWCRGQGSSGHTGGTWSVPTRARRESGLHGCLTDGRDARNRFEIIGGELSGFLKPGVNFEGSWVCEAGWSTAGASGQEAPGSQK